MSITIDIELSKPEGEDWRAMGTVHGGWSGAVYGEAATARRAVANALYEPLGRQIREDAKLVIVLSALLGHIAMWAVRLSPYVVPPGLASVIAEFESVARPLFPIFRPDFPMREMTERELKGLLIEYLLPIEQVQQWNRRRNGSTAPYGVVTATSRPDPDDDFIDLYALAQNIARSVASESEG